MTILIVCVRMSDSAPLIFGIVLLDKCTLFTTLEIFLSEIVLVSLLATLQRRPLWFVLEESHGFCVLFLL
jgi:hypothetical protein